MELKKKIVVYVTFISIFIILNAVITKLTIYLHQASGYPNLFLINTSVYALYFIIGIAMNFFLEKKVILNSMACSSLCAIFSIVIFNVSYDDKLGYFILILCTALLSGFSAFLTFLIKRAISS